MKKIKDEGIVMEAVSEYVIKKKDNASVHIEKGTKLKKSKDAEVFARQFYGDDLEIYESFFIIITNRNMRPIAWMKISQGGISGTVIDVKLIALYAIQNLGSCVILVHNHPSGNLLPSDQDKYITKKIKDCLKICDVQVTDHLILSSDGYLSFADEGII